MRSATRWWFVGSAAGFPAFLGVALLVTNGKELHAYQHSSGRDRSGWRGHDHDRRARTVSFPIIDAERGGSITGVLGGLNRLLEMAIAGEKTEGGTMLVPGHGRVSDEADLVEYRDMVTIIRDRVQDMVNRGMTLAQVQAAKPTMEYDGIYGSAAGWSSAQFVEAIFRGLKPQQASRGR